MPIHPLSPFPLVTGDSAPKTRHTVKPYHYIVVVHKWVFLFYSQRFFFILISVDGLFSSWQCWGLNLEPCALLGKGGTTELSLATAPFFIYSRIYLLFVLRWGFQEPCVVKAEDDFELLILLPLPLEYWTPGESHPMQFIGCWKWDTGFQEGWASTLHHQA